MSTSHQLDERTKAATATPTPTRPETLTNRLNLGIDTLKADILALQVRSNGQNLSSVSNDEGKRFLDKEVKRALKEIAADPKLLFNTDASNAHFEGIAATAVQTICTQKGYYASQGSFQKLEEGSLPKLNLDVVALRKQILDGFPGAGGIILGARITEEGKKALDKSLSIALLTIATNPQLFDKARANAFFDRAVQDTGANLNADPKLAITDAELVRIAVTKPVSKLLVGPTASRDTRRAVTTALTPLIQRALLTRGEDGQPNGNLLSTLTAEEIKTLNANLAAEIGKFRNFLVTPSEKANTNTFLVGSLQIGDGSVTATPSELFTARTAAKAHLASLDAVRLTHLAEVAPEINADMAAAATARDIAVKAQADAKAEETRVAKEEKAARDAANPSWFARTFRGAKAATATAPATTTGGTNSDFDDAGFPLMPATDTVTVLPDRTEGASSHPSSQDDLLGGGSTTTAPGTDRIERAVTPPAEVAERQSPTSFVDRVSPSSTRAATPTDAAGEPLTPTRVAALEAQRKAALLAKDPTL